MPAAIDITGQRFGRLVVLALHAPKNPNGLRYWVCTCDCGGQAITNTSRLISGETKSCGCLNRENTKIRSTKHGQNRRSGATPVYRSWNQMLQRCYNPKTPRFEHYGGRGIRVCERWHLFVNFFEDMGPRPVSHSIERIDVNGNYEPANCKWIPKAEQSKNQRRSKRAQKPPSTPLGTLPQDSTPPVLQS
jgi:hypothetical protein